tara:strand:- start:1301 stop:1996 length:696 start_codon:yes stop_codon:yes gene_type:complete
MTTDSIVQLENVSRHYQDGQSLVHAVDCVDLTIQKGEFAVLSGPSGSGKTTMLNLIGGLDLPTIGLIKIENQITNDLTQNQLTELRLHRIGFVFQAYNLLPVLTVYENVQLILQFQKAPVEQHEGLIIPLLRNLEILDLKDRFPAQLSGGQQQRVAVARALCGQPALILADEPTANLDSSTSANLLSLMHRLNQEQNVTFLFSSHDPDVVNIAKRVIHMKDGMIHEDIRRD